MSTFHLIKRVSQVAVVTSTIYVGGIWYASNHPQFEKYVPLSHTVIDFLEEREFSSQAAARARKVNDQETQLLNSLYRRKITPSDSVSNTTLKSSADENRNASQITSAVVPSSNVSSLTSRLDQELTAEDRLKSTSSRSDATSTLFSKDPLAPSNFFDAISGTVSSSREYLPLVLLPDDNDENVNNVAMSLNSLISNINNMVVTEDSVISVSTTLEELAREKATSKPHYANALLVKSQHFDALYQSYKLLWDEYLDNQNSNGVSSVSDKKETNPVVYEYIRKMAKEITDTEILLVKLMNSKSDLVLTNEQKDREFQDDYYSRPHHISKGVKDVNKKWINQPETLASSQPSTINITETSSTLVESSNSSSSSVESKQLSIIDPTIYGAIKPTDLSLQLELALTLLVNALQQQSSIPLGPYIQGVRDAVDHYSNRWSYPSLGNTVTSSESHDRKTLITEALKSVSVPKDVDLKPILDDILANYDDEKKHS